MGFSLALCNHIYCILAEMFSLFCWTATLDKMFSFKMNNDFSCEKKGKKNSTVKGDLRRIIDIWQIMPVLKYLLPLKAWSIFISFVCHYWWNSEVLILKNHACYLNIVFPWGWGTWRRCNRSRKRKLWRAW